VNITPHKNNWVRITGMNAAQLRWMREEIRDRLYDEGAWYTSKKHVEDLNRLGDPAPEDTTPGVFDDYAILYLRSDAPMPIVDAVWRTLAKLHHPDVGGEEETFKRVLAAYNRIKGGRID